MPVDSPPTLVTVLTGPAGIGRTTALSRLRDRAGERGAPTVSVRLAPPENQLPFHLVSRLVGELSLLPTVERHHRSPTAESPGGDGSAAVERQAVMLADGLAAQPGLVVLVDDAQWIDDASLTVLERAVRMRPDPAVRLVCAVRTPAGPAVTGRVLLDRLRADGLARVVTLRPLPTRELDGVVADLLGVPPHPSLRRHLRRTSRGVPAALHVALDAHRRSGSVRVVDHRARLTGAEPTFDQPAVHALLAPIRALPTPAWAVAKAVAVLHPLDGAVPALTATALDLTREEVASGLADLVEARVLRLRRRDGQLTWRFVVPLLGPALRSQLGAFERRSLARVAVDALWSGVAHCADPAYLADRLAEAGRLAGGDRVVRDLLRAGTTAPAADGLAAATWLTAAVELAATPTERASAVLARTSVHCLRGDFPAAGRDALLLLDRYAGDLPSDRWPELLLGYLTSLRGTGDVEAVRRIADGQYDLPGPAGPVAVARAAALCMLGRLAEAERLLVDLTLDRDEPAAVTLRSAVATLRGRPLPADPPDPGRHPQLPLLVATLVRASAMVGDPDAAERVLTEQALDRSRLPQLDQALLAWPRGRWDEALDLAGLSLADNSVGGFQPGHSALCHAAAVSYLGRGRPARARALLAGARIGQPALPYLLDLAEAEIERAFGADVAAARLVSAGLTGATQSGAVPGVAELWLLHTELAVARGDGDAARQGVDETGRLATATGSAYVTVHHLLARVAADRSGTAAQEAVSIARELGQPFLLAGVAQRAAVVGDDPAPLLGEAYELYRGLDAGLHRCWIRKLMRAHDVPVPGRAETVVENERLLATLVAEGASNRELATVLRTSEKSVEGRLSRLFARTGCRSRVELATAVITGDYQPE
nr:LuxR family transcriptional regulator [Micromonospora sp. HNM0581]